jgi:hypothetical protein
MPPLPAPAVDADPAAAIPPPRALRRVVVLLLVNLGLSLALTVATVILRHSIVDYQLDHRHVTDPAVRHTVRHGYVYAILARAFGNIVLSIVYAFLVRALFRGRRWAYRRVIWLSAAGIFALLAMQATPYPVWMHVEQIAQTLVLAAMLYTVTRRDVRAYFAKGLPGRNIRRFRRR